LSEEDIPVSSMNSLNIVSRKEVVRWTYLKIHSLQVLLAARVRKSDGFGQDGEGHRQVQPHPVSYSGGRSY